MIAKWLTAMSIAATSAVAVLVMATAPRPVLAADPVETGRFVWHDLMARDVGAARKFYGELLGWRFEDTRRGDRPYVLASSAAGRVAGIVDISAMANAGQQWLSFMAVDDVNKSAAQVRSDGGRSSSNLATWMASGGPPLSPTRKGHRSGWRNCFATRQTLSSQ